MCDLTTNTIVGDNESKRISCLVDTKYYDEIITKLYLQARREYESTIQYPEKEKLQQEEKMHNQKSRGRRRIL
ncbi:MAG: hypothetical protein ACJ71L_11060 [Nitrososphaeraceae archaeon]